MSTVFAKIFAFIPDFFFWTLFDKNHPCFSLPWRPSAQKAAPQASAHGAA
jgi:hypothetical protein